MNDIKRAFFDQLHDDFSQDPPSTERVRACISDLADALCKFVPNKPDLHAKIKSDIVCDEVSVQTMYHTIAGLTKWMARFQAPFQDCITDKWLSEFKSATNYADFLRDFFEAYYDHIEVVYKEVNEARHRLVNGESAVPPEHRPVIKGANGVPDFMRSGH